MVVQSLKFKILKIKNGISFASHLTKLSMVM